MDHSRSPSCQRANGSADDVGSVDIWQRFTRALPHGRLHVVDRSGHIPWLDEPTAVGKVLSQFLDAA